MSGLCRDCFTLFEGPSPKRCPACRSPRTREHSELSELSIAHIDCDAFYASIEKRDDPSIADKPVIVGGGKRGVVSTCCYIARTFGVRSAMPMFKALEACPNAVVIRPNISKYVSVSKEVKKLFLESTPLVEPLSLDEAFLDLSGTERLHKQVPAQTLAKLASRIEKEIAITISIGLSFNKFLAKVASDLDKPRGFQLIGKTEAVAFLDAKPASILPGVGKVFAANLAKAGIRTIGDIRRRSPTELAAEFGSTGSWIWQLSNAQDGRKIEPRTEAKTISAEVTLNENSADAAELRHILWELSEKVSYRAKLSSAGGKTIQLKLKTASFKSITRSHTLDRPTQLAHRIFEHGSALLLGEIKGARYRLIGIGLSNLTPASDCDEDDLIDQTGNKKKRAELAMDRLREKFGRAAIKKGRSL